MICCYLSLEFCEHVLLEISESKIPWLASCRRYWLGPWCPTAIIWLSATSCVKNFLTHVLQGILGLPCLVVAMWPFAASCLKNSSAHVLQGILGFPCPVAVMCSSAALCVSNILAQVWHPNCGPFPLYWSRLLLCTSRGEVVACTFRAFFFSC